ncbi:unnamed protein product [Amoebophrya sp. A120]|nr:unnamed protein product [Amoebophrya sp. A120]|eukprot:GSA120T00022461001.1
MYLPPADDVEKEEYAGLTGPDPWKAAEPLYPSYLADTKQSVAFEAAQKAAKYAQVANYFETIATKHWQIGQSCKENAVLAYRQAENEKYEKSYESSDLLKNLRKTCDRFKNWLLVTKKEVEPDFGSANREAEEDAAKVKEGGGEGDGTTTGGGAGEDAESTLSPEEGGIAEPPGDDVSGAAASSATPEDNQDPSNEFIRNKALLTSAPVMKARVLCGNLERQILASNMNSSSGNKQGQLYITPPNTYPRMPIWPPAQTDLSAFVGEESRIGAGMMGGSSAGGFSASSSGGGGGAADMMMSNVLMK